MSNYTLWYTRCPVPTSFSVALRLGWLHDEFAPDGIDLRPLQQNRERAVLASHYTHSFAQSIRHGGNVPAIWTRSIGSDVRLIGLTWTDSPHVILALPDSGIRTPADLKGKRLLVPRNPATELDWWPYTGLRIYETALGTAGLTLADVQLVNRERARDTFDPKNVELKPDGTVNRHGRGIPGVHREDLFALVRGEVDAIFSESTFATHLVNFLGAHIVANVTQSAPLEQRDNNAIPQTLTISGGVLLERPDLVTRLLVKLLEVGEWAKTHHSEVVRIVALETGSSEEVVEQTYGSALSQQLSIDLSPANVAVITRRKDFALKHGLIKNDFKIEDWIAREPLEEAQRIFQKRELAAAV